MYSPLWNFQNIFSWNVSKPFLSKKENSLPSLSSFSPVKLLPKETNRNDENFEKYFLEFSSNGQKVGKIILRIFEDVGPMGESFKDFVTMRQGFGYKGSRVYAVHPGEWCLIGDLLFQEKDNHQFVPQNGTLENLAEEDNESFLQVESYSSKKKPQKIYEGEHSVPTVKYIYEGKPGSLITVGSSIARCTKNLNYDWSVGPQFKVTFVKPIISCGEVFGEVLSGMSCLRRISERATINTEPTDRITISDCGVVSFFK